ncbi:hypothetical protein [Streptomyces umbrinus]|uniref:hypothetical protein n=1 Tax=Streptomyces umbrinus TaxID=67370 RepID=UPI003C2BF710
MPGPPCGNNPRYQMSPGDRAAVAEFRAYLLARAKEKTVTELDAAREALRGYSLRPGFVDALERFEAAVRANERATPPEPMDDDQARARLAPLEAKARELREQRDAKLREETALDMGRELLRDGLEAFLPRLVGPENARRVLNELRRTATGAQP